MPTYTYVCKSCGTSFDLFHDMFDESEKACPRCNSTNVDRQIGAGIGLIFNGAGFYATDYKKDKKPEPDRDV